MDEQMSKISTLNALGQAQADLEAAAKKYRTTQETLVKAEAANDAAREAYEGALVSFNQATRNVKSASTVVDLLAR
jgi:hypothetical protein